VVATGVAAGIAFGVGGVVSQALDATSSTAAAAIRRTRPQPTRAPDAG
jgi:hypothetical protein